MTTLSNAKMASLKDKIEKVEEAKEELAQAEEEVKTYVKKDKKSKKVVK